jgi:DNA-directed RNA polymerase specialized sigma24 family protein
MAGRVMALNRDDRIRLAQVERGVATMGSRLREIFLMHRLESIGYPQIGARLGLSVAEVERYIASAMLHLVRAMDEAEGGGGG